MVPAPEEGLPEEVFLLVSRLTPLVNVDLLIRDDSGRTLLTWREDRFYGSGWHVPGGIIRYRETAAERLRAVAKEELRSGVAFASEPMGVYETIDRRTRDRGHLISLLYACRLLDPLDERRRFVPEEPQENQWRWHTKCPNELIAAQRHYERFIGS